MAAKNSNSLSMHPLKREAMLKTTAKHCNKSQPNTAKKFLKHLELPIYYRIFAPNQIDNRDERIQKKE